MVTLERMVGYVLINASLMTKLLLFLLQMGKLSDRLAMKKPRVNLCVVDKKQQEKMRKRQEMQRVMARKIVPKKK